MKIKYQKWALEQDLRGYLRTNWAINDLKEHWVLELAWMDNHMDENDDSHYMTHFRCLLIIKRGVESFKFAPQIN